MGKETRHREITSKVRGKADEKGKSKQVVIKWVETFKKKYLRTIRRFISTLKFILSGVL